MLRRCLRRTTFFLTGTSGICVGLVDWEYAVPQRGPVLVCLAEDALSTASARGRDGPASWAPEDEATRLKVIAGVRDRQRRCLQDQVVELLVPRVVLRLPSSNTTCFSGNRTAASL